MDKLATIVNGVLANLNTTANSSAAESERKQENTTAPSANATARCALCNDLGWVSSGLVPDRLGNYNANAIRCVCKAEEDKARRAQFLLKMDGLTQREREYRFATIKDNYDPGVLTSLKATVDARAGLITLMGSFGVGKTTILMCAVNEARSAGRLAIYTTVTDLLSYLRSTFQPDADDSFDKYWEALIRCEVLGLDELDEFNTTPWAMERFLRLIDERWRRMDEVLTLCATNNRPQALPGKIQSRLRDARAQMIELKGRDIRQSPR